MEKKNEFIRVVKKEVLPILKKQEGFLEFLPLVPESKTEKVLAVTLWTDKKELERDENEWYPRVGQILKPYLTNLSAQALHAGDLALQALRKNTDRLAQNHPESRAGAITCPGPVHPQLQTVSS
jgi:hypothetical protein